jgi:hypothetical protein
LSRDQRGEPATPQVERTFDEMTLLSSIDRPQAKVLIFDGWSLCQAEGLYNNRITGRVLAAATLASEPTQELYPSLREVYHVAAIAPLTRSEAVVRVAPWPRVHAVDAWRKQFFPLTRLHPHTGSRRGAITGGGHPPTPAGERITACLPLLQ